MELWRDKAAARGNRSHVEQVAANLTTKINKVKPFLKRNGWVMKRRKYTTPTRGEFDMFVWYPSNSPAPDMSDVYRAGPLGGFFLNATVDSSTPLSHTICGHLAAIDGIENDIDKRPRHDVSISSSGSAEATGEGGGGDGGGGDGGDGGGGGGVGGDLLEHVVAGIPRISGSAATATATMTAAPSALNTETDDDGMAGEAASDSGGGASAVVTHLQLKEGDITHLPQGASPFSVTTTTEALNTESLAAAPADAAAAAAPAALPDATAPHAARDAVSNATTAATRGLSESLRVKDLQLVGGADGGSSELGRGSFGIVHRVRHLVDEDDYALKVVDLGALALRFGSLDDRRLQKEVRWVVAWLMLRGGRRSR